MLFLAEDDCERQYERITESFRWKLPHRFLGYPTNYSAPNPDDNGTQLLAATEVGPVNHRVEIYTIRGFVRDYLNFDITGEIEPADWLTFGEQALRTITAGAVFHDDLGLEAVRARFAYYPRDIWLYLLAAGWARIGQEEHLMGRAGLVGDELGSALIGARLVRDVMRLGFLMERQYAPYPKWFGTAFQRLACAPHSRKISDSRNWPRRGRSAKAICVRRTRSQRRCTTGWRSPSRCRRRSGPSGGGRSGSSAASVSPRRCERRSRTRP